MALGHALWETFLTASRKLEHPSTTAQLQASCARSFMLVHKAVMQMSCTDPGVLKAVAGLKDGHGVNASQGALPAAAAETDNKDVHCGGKAPAEVDGGGEADGGDG
eukprot:3880886-Pleurochrysis_carterae.AAC.1